MILIALGANLPSRAGSPAETLRAALAALADRGISVGAVSRFFRTPAWPDPHDPPFVNAVARVETELAPRALLDVLLNLETQFGRQPGPRNAPRPLDLDLVDYDGRTEDGPPELPHPRIAERGFVLIPLAEIAPGWRHPVSGKTVEALIVGLSQDQRKVEIAE